MNRNRRGEIGGAFSYESGAAAIQLLYMVRALPHVRLILNCINGLTLFSPRASQQLYHNISPFSSSLFSYVQHIVVLLCRIVYVSIASPFDGLCRPLSLLYHVVLDDFQLDTMDTPRQL